MNGEQKRTSPWVWVGLGCLGAVVVAVAAVMGVAWFGYRKVKQFEADLKDPAARTAKVHRILGTDRLPEGYHAVMGMSVPLVMDMAVLSDHPPEYDPEGRQVGRRGLGQRGFFYMRMLGAGRDKQEIRDYFEGRSDDPEVLRRNNIRIQRSGEVLRRGVIDMSEQLKLMYMAQRGELDMSSSRASGINTMMLIECQGDSRQRFAVWFGPEPGMEAGREPGMEAGRERAAPAEPRAEAELDLSGTPADETAIREFMGHFSLCGS